MLGSKTQPRVAPLPCRPVNPRQPSRAHNLYGERRTWSAYGEAYKPEHVRAGVGPRTLRTAPVHVMWDAREKNYFST
jgi:hypothetical protein